MSFLILDLYAHMSWADAEHWRVIESNSQLHGDKQVRERLHHIHLTQRAFYSIVSGEPLVIRRLEDFQTASALKEYAKQTHGLFNVFLQSGTEKKLQEVVTIPWFKDPPIQISIEQALLQAAMHSHYHRGQNAIRMRELSIEPPLTDYIAWLWKSNPHANWG